jgi:hypothetical protein
MAKKRMAFLMKQADVFSSFLGASVLQPYASCPLCIRTLASSEACGWRPVCAP